MGLWPYGAQHIRSLRDRLVGNMVAATAQKRKSQIHKVKVETAVDLAELELRLKREFKDQISELRDDLGGKLDKVLKHLGIE